VTSYVEIYALLLEQITHALQQLSQLVDLTFRHRDKVLQAPIAHSFSRIRILIKALIKPFGLVSAPKLPIKFRVEPWP
jgi:hypothetical protein